MEEKWNKNAGLRPVKLLGASLMTVGFLAALGYDNELVQAAENTETKPVISTVEKPEVARAATEEKNENVSDAPRVEVLNDTDSANKPDEGLVAHTDTTASITLANPSETTPVENAENAAEEAPAAGDKVLADEETSITIEQYKRASATEMAAWVREGKISPEKLMDYAYTVIDETNPTLNNVITTRRELAMEELEAMKKEMAETGVIRPFYGVPILAKGLTHTVVGGVNANGVGFMKDNISKSNHIIIKTLQKAGFVVLGQTNYPQLGLINVTHSDLYGITRNPWNLEYSPGGSSGGSAAAVVIGQVPIATSNDGGGSTRIPASFSGLIGLHPTRGILVGNSTSERSNVTQFSLMRDMADVNALFDILLKENAADKLITTKLNDFVNLKGETNKKPIAYTLATPGGTPLSEEAKAAVLDAVAFLREQGYEVVEVPAYPIDGVQMMMDYYTIIASSMQFLRSAAKTYLHRELQMGDVELLAWALVQAGENISKEDLDKTWEHVSLMSQQMHDFYEQYAFLLTATTAHPAPKADFEASPEALKPLMRDMSSLSKEERIQLIYDQWLPGWTLTPYTQMGNLTGTPSISLPTHLTKDGRPLGILFNGPQYSDRLLLQIGDLFNSHSKFISYYEQKDKEAEEEDQLSKDTEKPGDNTEKPGDTIKPGDQPNFENGPFKPVDDKRSDLDLKNEDSEDTADKDTTSEKPADKGSNVSDDHKGVTKQKVVTVKLPQTGAISSLGMGLVLTTLGAFTFKKKH